MGNLLKKGDLLVIHAKLWIQEILVHLKNEHHFSLVLRKVKTTFEKAIKSPKHLIR